MSFREASDECKPYLLKQFLQLKAEELAESLDERLRLQSRDHFSGSLLKVYPYFFWVGLSLAGIQTSNPSTHISGRMCAKYKPTFLVGAGMNR
jgi:hypothetical protein